jgi:hypothetical protein
MVLPPDDRKTVCLSLRARACMLRRPESSHSYFVSALEGGALERFIAFLLIFFLLFYQSLNQEKQQNLQL